jgi:SIR2-like domain
MEDQSYEKWMEFRIKLRKEEFRIALGSAYNETSMKLLLCEKLDINYDHDIEIEKSFKDTLHNIISYFERKGCLIKLLGEAYDGQSTNQELRTFYHSIREDIDDPSIKYELSKELQEQLEEIGDSLVRGKLIFFLGSGINYPPDGKTKNLPPSDIDIAEQLAEGTDFKKVIGLPCQVCPVKLEDRPKLLASEHICPIWKEILDSPQKKSQQLRYEQDLAFARLEMRCLSQCLLNKGYSGLRENLREILRDDCNIHPYQPNITQKFLATLGQKMNNNNLLILTTNYDCGLEKAFEGKFNFEVIYYFITDGDEPNFTGHFWHKSYFRDESKNDDEPGEILDQNSQMPQTPIIFKLYGGVLYKADKMYDSFAIAESHFINYLQRPKENFPPSLKNYFTDRNILFLGCNPNDADIFALLHRFFSERFSTKKQRPKGWFINPLKPGKIHDEKKWLKMGITLIDECSSDYLLSELQKCVADLVSK